MLHQNASAIGRVRSRISSESVQSFGKPNLLRVVRLASGDVRIRASVFVDDVSERFSVGREIPGARFPLYVSGPRAIFGRYIEQGNILVSAFFIGCDQQRRSVR